MHIPDAYEGLAPELKALHEHAVVEDKSPMNYYSIIGPDALEFLDRLVTRDLTRVAVGAGIYTPWLDEHGKVVIDTPVFRLGELHYVTMGGIIENWLTEHAGSHKVEIRDESNALMVMPLQGPASREIVETVTGEDWSDIRFMHGRATKVASCDLWVFRAGYSPQLGFEFHFDRRDALDVFDAVMAAGRDLGLLPIGQNAVQVARTEAGLIVPGIDYTRAGTDLQIAAYALLDDEGVVSPFEIGLGRFVNFDKPGPFIGKEAVLDEQAIGGPARTLVGLDVTWHDIVDLYEQSGQAPEIARRIDYRRHKVLKDGEVVGKATSLCWSPTIRRLISLAQVNTDHSEIGEELIIDWREHGTSFAADRVDGVVGGPVRATITQLPFTPKDEKFRSSQKNPSQ